MLTLLSEAATLGASHAAVVVDGRPGYRPYRATVAGIRRLSPHFLRVTFTAPDFGTFGTAGLDQRVKLVFPLPGVGISDFGADDPETLAEGSWYARWRDLPDPVRNPFRTYTVRGVRPEAREVDIDFVVHTDERPRADTYTDAGAAPVGTGPAARWLQHAAVGDELVLVGPDARSRDAGIGLDWHPGPATRLLLAGDETAAPAIAGILESLPEGRHARAFIEVPDAADALPLRLPAGCEVTWLVRGTAPHGSRLHAAVRAWVAAHPNLVASAGATGPQPLSDIDVDRETLWDSPQVGTDGAGGADFHAWLAGEAGMIKLLRRFLVSETGIDRSRVAFMGYWRSGRAEAQ